MDRHDLDRIRGLDRRRLLVLARQKHELQVAHVGGQRVVW